MFTIDAYSTYELKINLRELRLCTCEMRRYELKIYLYANQVRVVCGSVELFDQN